MSSTDTLYVAQAKTIEMLERGKDNVLRQRMEELGALSAPTAASCTCTVYDATNTSVATPTVSVTGSIAQATLTAATTSSLQLSEGWRIEWALAMPDGTTRLIRRDAALVRTRLLPPAGWSDVFGYEPSLDPTNAHRIHSMELPEMEPWLQAAWLEIESKLLAAGRRPWLVISPQAFRMALIYGTLALAFRSLATRLNAAWRDTAEHYEMLRDKAWPDLRFAYDADNDGAADGGATPQLQGATPTMWLGSRRSPSVRWS